METETKIASAVIVCPQCAGENTVAPDDKFIECTFCGSAIYVDKRKIVNHFVVACNFSREQAIGNLRRWMAGNFHVKDLDKNAEIATVYFYYFPLWYFKIKDASADKIYLQPAHSTPISEIKSINIPAGSLKPFHKKDFPTEQFINPDVMYESAKSWLQQTGVNIESLTESNLVHIPFYQAYYNYKGKQYSAMIEASSGKVYANIWPAKSEAPFRILFALSLITFFIVSIISFGIAFMIMEEFEGILLAEVIKAAGYGLAAIPLIIIAYFIAKKV